MNPLLELQWKIAMLKLALSGARDAVPFVNSHEEGRSLLLGLQAELRLQEQFAAQGKIDAERFRRVDEEKAR